MIEKFNTLSLRERKYAQTKITLLRSLLQALKTKKFSEIYIKDLAKESKISEPTFFNYFSSKDDILMYFLQLWSIKMVAYSQSLEEKGLTIKEIIQEIFTNTSSEISEIPRLLLEIIAYKTKKQTSSPHVITDAEKWLFFPDIKGIENIPYLEHIGFQNVLYPLIEKGIKQGEFKKEISIDSIFLTLISLFFGTALFLLPQDCFQWKKSINEQIQNALKNM